MRRQRGAGGPPSSSPSLMRLRLVVLSGSSLARGGQGQGRRAGRVREGSPDHAARVRCSGAAGLHLGASRPPPLGGNGSGDPSRTRPARLPCPWPTFVGVGLGEIRLSSNAESLGGDPSGLLSGG